MKLHREHQRFTRGKAGEQLQRLDLAVELERLQLACLAAQPAKALLQPDGTEARILGKGLLFADGMVDLYVEVAAEQQGERTACQRQPADPAVEFRNP